MQDLCIRLANAETAIFEAVNKALAENGLPCYLLEPIVAKIHRAVLDGKEKELAAARKKEVTEDGN